MNSGIIQFDFPDLFGPIFLEMAGRLLLAMAFGMVLGIDREARDKPAGMRSHMLVSLAAACLTMMTFAIIDASDAFGETVRADPLRVIEAVVAGIAFLGAGAIIQGRGKVHGITTGASMWVAGAIGIATGLGNYALATLTTVFAFAVLFLLGRLEAYLKKNAGAENR
jgi:putative Mg2+ transporter-C (MgtC) family protein